MQSATRVIMREKGDDAISEENLVSLLRYSTTNGGYSTSPYLVPSEQRKILSDTLNTTPFGSVFDSFNVNHAIEAVYIDIRNADDQCRLQLCPVAYAGATDTEAVKEYFKNKRSQPGYVDIVDGMDIATFTFIYYIGKRVSGRHGRHLIGIYECSKINDVDMYKPLWELSSTTTLKNDEKGWWLSTNGECIDEPKKCYYCDSITRVYCKIKLDISNNVYKKAIRMTPNEQQTIIDKALKKLPSGIYFNVDEILCDAPNPGVYKISRKLADMQIDHSTRQTQRYFSNRKAIFDDYAVPNTLDNVCIYFIVHNQDMHKQIFGIYEEATDISDEKYCTCLYGAY